MTDVNNCGAVKNVCSSNYTSCSEGVCSTSPTIIISSGTPLWSASVNGSIDDSTFSVSLPFNITLYNTTTPTVTVSTNGVSHCSLNLFESNISMKTNNQTINILGYLPWWMLFCLFGNHSSSQFILWYNSISFLGRSLYLWEHITRHILHQPGHGTESYPHLRILLQSLLSINKLLSFSSTILRKST